MKSAVIFPGQGSQSVGMLSELAEHYSIVDEIFNQANETLGYDLWQIIKNDESQLNQTTITQPAMLSAGFAVYQVCKKVLNINPIVMAGHSLGEYTALVCAGAIEFQDAVNLVSKRGELMQHAVPEGTGAMAAILGLDDEIIKSIAKKTSGIVEAVNFNSKGQVVIAGEKNAVKVACETAKEFGAKRAIILPVSVPSHSSLMKPAADKFSDYLQNITINIPNIPVVNNVSATVVTDPTQIRDALIRQLYNPVLWVDSIQNIARQGVTHLIESGPGKVLTGLNKRIDKNSTIFPVFDIASLNKAKDIFI